MTHIVDQYGEEIAPAPPRPRASFDDGEDWVEWNGGQFPTAGRSSLAVSAVWACVLVIAQTVASLPLITYSGDRADTSRKRRSGGVARLLARQPNPAMGSMIWREALVSTAVATGNGFSQIIRDMRGRISQIWPLPADRVSLQWDRSTARMLYHVQTAQDQFVTLDQDEVLHVRGMGYGGVWGYSPIAVHRATIDRSYQLGRFAGQMFREGGGPSGAIEVPNALTDDGVRNLRESITEKIRNRKPLVLEQGAKWNQISINPEDGQFLQTRQFEVTEVCRIFNVPPHKVQDLQKATWNNLEQMNTQFYTDCIRPWLERVEEEIDIKCFPDGRSHVEHDANALLRADLAGRTAAYTSGITTGWLERNEARIAENLPPDDSIAGFLQPLNMATVGGEDSADVQPAPADPAPSDPVPSDTMAHLADFVADAVTDIVKHEQRKISAAAKRVRNIDDWKPEYYPRHREYVRIKLESIRKAVARARGDDAAFGFVESAVDLLTERSMAECDNLALVSQWHETRINDDTWAIMSMLEG